MHKVSFERQEDRVVGAILRRQAEAIPDAPYFVRDGDRFSFGRVNELANAYAAGFRSLGVGPGDTVTIFMTPSPELVLTTFGLNKLGAIWIPTNVDYRGVWLRTSFVDSRARVLVVDEALLPRVAELGGPLPFERIVVRGSPEPKIDGVSMHALAEVGGQRGEEPEIASRHCDTAAVLWTSGTTGRSKGVMQSHSAWIRAAEKAVGNFAMEPGSMLYCCLPMYNSAAWIGNFYPALIAGLPVAFDDHFSVKTFWDRTRFYGATHAFTLGAMHVFLWNAPPRPDDRDNPVRVFSPVPIPDRILVPFMERFGIERVVQGYGQSEAFTVFIRIDDGTRSWKRGSAGVPQEGFDVRLLDDEDNEVPVGQVGEICVRPSAPYSIFNGYFHDPERTLVSFRNLWYHTGDLGRRDQDGEFFFVDRKADYIRYKGRSVASVELEAVVNSHPAVAESAAYGVSSAELESEAEIKIEVVLRPGASVAADELARFVNQNAPHFMVPRYIEFVGELPHTPTGRVQKFLLRERGVTPQTWDRDRAGFVVER